MLAAGLVLALMAGTLVVLDRLCPPPLATAGEVSVVVLDRKGRLLRPFTIRDGRWRLPVHPGDVDPRFVRMLIAYEDRRFYAHSGVDPLALIRAAGQWLANGRIVSGGSTLTMQLARLIEPRQRRSLGAKLRQIFRALQIEARLDKKQILQLYLTLAPYGGNLEGVRAAALAWFGKEPRKLSVSEAALLAALPQAPESRRPDRHPEAARAAQNRVLARMQALGIIPAADAVAARAAPLPSARTPLPALAAHQSLRVARARPATGRHVLAIDAALQASLERLARRQARRLGPRISVAILAADFRNGDVLARVGSADFTDEKRAGHIDMTRAIRSPGSALKPLIYGMGFEAGLAHPATLIDDTPRDFGGYAPQNFDQKFNGPMSIRKALERSLNVPAVSMLDAVGPARFMARMKASGIPVRLPEGAAPSLAVALGGMGLSLDGLVRLYAALARGGTMAGLHDLAATGKRQQARHRARLLEAVAAWYVTDILAGTLPPRHGLRGKIAYKTGTSYGYRDAWSVGYDGRHVIGVWVGRPDGSSVPGLTGRRAAAPVLFESFARLSAGGYAPLPPPPRGALITSNAGLPLPLKHFGPARFMSRKASGHKLDIVYPPDQAHVDLGLGTPGGERMPLVVKIRGGKPPFIWFANGALIARVKHRRTVNWMPDSSGFSSLTVLDALGRTDSVSVLLE